LGELKKVIFYKCLIASSLPDSVIFLAWYLLE